NRSLEQLVIYNWSFMSFAHAGQPARRLAGIVATANLFPTLGVQPQLGRVFSEREDQPGNHVVVLGYNFWFHQLGADTNIIGRTLRFDGESLEVIGVMPRDFDYPLLWGGIDVWRPLALTAEGRKDRGSFYLNALGRLKPGVTQAQSEAELKAICSRLPGN